MMAILAILAGFLSTSPADASGGNTTYVPITKVGTGSLSNQTGTGSFTDSLNDELRRGEEEIDRQIPHSSYSAARVPANGVPTPGEMALTASNPGFSGFNGLTHFDQRLAGTGAYENSQFSLEPPDQALCVGNGYVLESVNTAVRVRDMKGTALTAPTPINAFFGLPPEIDRVNLVYGDFTSDPKCYYDPDTGSFFFTILQADVVPATGDFTGKSSVLIAVSKTGDPTKNWYLYKVDTTNDGTGGTPVHPNCPCLGDQPLIGADANGFYISTNEFPWFVAGFNGAQVYTLDKYALAAGSLPTVVMFDTGSIAAPDGGTWYSLQPATTPPGGTYESAAGGTEYFMSALEFFGGLDNRIAVWAITNTSSLKSATPNVTLSYKVIDSQVYGLVPATEQMDGPRPLAEALGIPKEKLELMDGNDDRMQQVVYADGKLWAANSSPVRKPNKPTRAGIAYYIVRPSISGGTLAATMFKQGYIAASDAHVSYPSVAVNASGKGAIVFSLTSKNFYPSVGYVTLDKNGAGSIIHVAASGALPQDGITGYVSCGCSREPRTSRWGDYSAAVADEKGNVWFAAIYIPDLPRTILANWGTFIGTVTP
jgi:hypothetical protein